MMELVVIVAIGEGSVIGKDNQIPWHISEDLKRFKTLTTGHTVIMGRNTWESLPEKFRPLPDRKNIVLTSDMEYCGDGMETFTTLSYALKALSGKVDSDDKVFIIGGARLYEEALPLADILEITKVEGSYDGDVFFPEIDFNDWELKSEDKRDGFSFQTFRKK